MATNSTANIGFEKKIWDAACRIAWQYGASEYKSVVLGLIFLKYISRSFLMRNISSSLTKVTALRRM